MKKKYAGVPLMDEAGERVTVVGDDGEPVPGGCGVLAEFEVSANLAAEIGHVSAAGGGNTGRSVRATVRLDREGSRARAAREYQVWVRDGGFQLVRAGRGRTTQCLGPFPVGELLAAFRHGGQPGGAPTNRKRADAAWAGVQAYALAKDGTALAEEEEDDRDAFRDLLADMRHLADLRGWDFGEDLRVSGEAYGEDTRGAPPYPGAPPGAGPHAGGGAPGPLEPGHPHNPARAREAFHELTTEES